MDDIEARLVKCFAAVFPGLSESEIRNASVHSVEKWDSVATLNVLVVVQEEFGVEFDPEELEHLSSFEEILNQLSAKTKGR